MTNSALSIATLVGSRICHDLISPVGAINNGIELISMGGPIDTPELSLISDSVNNASARIKFFRIAFGSATGIQMMGAPEVAKIATDATAGSRHAIEWRADSDMPRPEVQALFLAILCVELALPLGGTITIARDNSGYRVSGTGPRLSCDADLWQSLKDNRQPEGLRPAQVQFALLVFASEELGRRLTVSESADQVDIAF